jgi:hypothetical protein
MPLVIERLFREMDKENVGYIQNGILLSHKE